jgi:hypothetical protein
MALMLKAPCRIWVRCSSAVWIFVGILTDPVTPVTALLLGGLFGSVLGAVVGGCEPEVAYRSTRRESVS